MKTGNYECFSYRQMKYLLENNVVPMSVTAHNKTKRTMWIYERNEALDKFLTKWTKKENLCQ